jgi:hypothetical protein
LGSVRFAESKLSLILFSKAIGDRRLALFWAILRFQILLPLPKIPRFRSSAFPR